MTLSPRPALPVGEVRIVRVLASGATFTPRPSPRPCNCWGAVAGSVPESPARIGRGEGEAWRG